MRSGVFADYKIFAGNSHPELAEEIAGIMGKPLGRATVTKFSDGEISDNSVKLCKKDRAWVLGCIAKAGLSLQEVFLMTARMDGTHKIIRKEQKKAG